MSAAIIRPAQDRELRACRVLLPEAFRVPAGDAEWHNGP